MKSFLILIVCLGFTFKAQSHEYYFGFAELAYQSEDNRLEGTLVLSTHDLEDWLREKGLEVVELELHGGDLDFLIKMEKILFSGFKIENNGALLNLQTIGYEILDTGVIYLYFHSETTDKPKELNITFDLLMDKFPEQQNKITYKDGASSYTAVFLPSKTKSSISVR